MRKKNNEYEEYNINGLTWTEADHEYPITGRDGQEINSHTHFVMSYEERSVYVTWSCFFITVDPLKWVLHSSGVG